MPCVGVDNLCFASPTLRLSLIGSPPPQSPLRGDENKSLLNFHVLYYGGVRLPPPNACYFGKVILKQRGYLTSSRCMNSSRKRIAKRGFPFPQYASYEGGKGQSL